MGAQNYFKGKFQEGTFANGEGPISGIQIKSEPEEKGRLGTENTSGQKLSLMGASGTDGLDGRAEEKGLDIYASNYKGPQNFKPNNMGEVSPYAINSTK